MRKSAAIATILVGMVVFAWSQAPKPKSSVHVSHVSPTTVIVTCVDGSKAKVDDMQGLAMITCPALRPLPPTDLENKVR